MTDEYMCPFCVTPWKCNGPHIDESDLPELLTYAATVRLTALEEVRDVIELMHPKCEEACEMCADWNDLLAAVDPIISSARKVATPDQYRQDHSEHGDEHDPLCGWKTLTDCFPADDCGECALISRVRSELLHQAKQVIGDRVADLKSCHKNDDCHVIAYGAELALDDLQERYRVTVR